MNEDKKQKLQEAVMEALQEVKEEIKFEKAKAKMDVAAMHKNQLISAAEFMLTILAAESPHPAVPSRTYYQEASPAEYNVCLHSHGL